MTAHVRSALFWPVFLVGSAGYVLTAMLVAFVRPSWVGPVSRGWARFFKRAAARVLGIRSRVEGTPPTEPHLFAFKHGSMLETADTLLTGNNPAVVLKKELAHIPGWGWAARRYGVIAVDREGGSAALRTMLAEARAASGAGRSVAIFPEGTRVPWGEAPPLQPGFAGLYRAVGLPVVPVAIDSARVWRRGWVQRPGVVTFRYGEVIPAGLAREEVEARVHRAINALNPA